MADVKTLWMISSTAQAAFDAAKRAGGNWADAVDRALQDAGVETLSAVAFGPERDTTIIAAVRIDGTAYLVKRLDDGQWDVGVAPVRKWPGPHHYDATGRRGPPEPVPDDLEIVKSCACGVSYTRADWGELPYVGPQDDGTELLEYRTCRCGSTLAVVVGPSAPRVCLACTVHEGPKPPAPEWPYLLALLDVAARGLTPVLAGLCPGHRSMYELTRVDEARRARDTGRKGRPS